MGGTGELESGAASLSATSSYTGHHVHWPSALGAPSGSPPTARREAEGECLQGPVSVKGIIWQGCLCVFLQCSCVPTPTPNPDPTHPGKETVGQVITSTVKKDIWRN